MAVLNWISVGWVKEAHGLKGELFLVFKAGASDWQNRLKKICLSKKSRTRPPVSSSIEESQQVYEVLKFRCHKEGLLVFLEGVTDRTQAELWRGAEVLIPADYIVAAPGERIYLGQILGFIVFDQMLGEVGPILTFSSNGAQDLLVVENRKGKFEIPFVDDFIESIDWERKQIKMNLPPGLVEV